MRKFIFLVIIAACAFGFWKKYDSGEPVLPRFENSAPVVIEFIDGRELLAKLKSVETGRQVSLRQLADNRKPIDSGVSCNDEAGKKAFRERYDKEQAELTKAIQVELDRIQQNR